MVISGISRPIIRGWVAWFTGRKHKQSQKRMLSESAQNFVLQHWNNIPQAVCSTYTDSVKYGGEIYDSKGAS